MSSIKSSRLKLLPAFTLCLGLFSGSVLADTYEVTLTNITGAQLFTPRLAVTHSGGKLFTLGKPALPELESVAEAGDIGPLMALVDSLGAAAGDMQVGDGILMPGSSQTLMIEGEPGNLFTLVFMLLPTNDGFSGLNAVVLPDSGTLTLYTTAYDAGTETNDESCMHIPGPQCGGEASSPEDTGEGYVYVHPGIHGSGDLDASMYDWNNPVAMVSITRM